ncbi:hypothetical protein VTK73DRAFT_4940 [Phialemonium thermophilum]|uniref:Uncharacterized protein n=1 Tax=Phialemonium thermophilum TaxID=223376 RepID=A0ABR3V4M5_9PEZI
MADLKLWMEEITVPCGEEARESAEDDQSVAMTEEDDVEQQEEDSAAYSSEAFPGETRESSFTDTSGSVYGEENAMARAEPFLGETVLPEDEGLDGDDFSSPMSDVLYHQRLHSVPYAAMPPTMPPSDLTYAGMHHAMTNAMFGMGGSGSAGQTYRSPGSSIATVTLENFHAEHPILPPSTTTARGDDLADMGFELAFLSQADGTLEMDEFDS